MIYVNGIEFEFNPNDKIFYLEGECDESIRTPRKYKGAHECGICRKHMDKHHKQCNFCARMGCSECIYKKYPYPVNNPDNHNKGKICKLCETKFYIKKVILSQAHIIVDTSEHI